ncbi:MAG: hypothetical protein IPO26_15980 [Saprospiraceae bacterium]|nr:hypothetical protein [Saprospiraceae bacterium]
MLLSFCNSFEPLLLSLLVLTGIVGSIYLWSKFVQSETTTIQGSQGSPASAVAALFAANDEAPANDFDEYVEIESKVVANQTFNFQFLKDEKASRYVMEMGDGVRLIVTQKNLMYEYKQPGKYVIELKEIKNGLLHVIGTKKIKVK